VHLASKSGNPITRVQISWEDAQGGTQFVPTSSGGITCGYLLPQNDTANGCTDPLVSSTGMVRATLMPIRPGVQTADLSNDTSTYFLYPKDNGTARVVGTQANAPGAGNLKNGIFINGNCNAASKPTYSHSCNAEINGLGISNEMYLRIKSVYRPTSVTIKIFDAAGQTNILGAQAVIDVTGKAQDVLRRIQVRVPIDNSYKFPEFALETSDSICKRTAVLPNSAIVQPPLAGIDYNSSDLTGVCDPTTN
jgi:hypothetical protein